MIKLSKKRYSQLKLTTLAFLSINLAKPVFADSLNEMFHLGVDFSFLRLNSDYPNELNKSGFAIAPKAGLLFQGSDLELETGLGFRFSQLSGSQLGVNRKIKFRSALWDLHFRVKTSDSFSIGPMLQFAFGTDMSHTETVQAQSSQLFNIGLSGRYRLNEAPISFTFRGLMDLNLSNQLLWGIGVGILYHFPQISSSKASSVYAEAAPTPVAQAPIQHFVPYSNPRPEVEYGDDFILIRLPEDVLLFPTNVSALNNKQKNYVHRLGDVLNGNQNDWQKIIVIGHTDFLGTHSHNDNLSRERARSVRMALEGSGTSANRITSIGRGKREPLTWESDRISLSKNRRVEIKLEGVKSNSTIGDQIQSIDPDAE